MERAISCNVLKGRITPRVNNFFLKCLYLLVTIEQVVSWSYIYQIGRKKGSPAELKNNQMLSLFTAIEISLKVNMSMNLYTPRILTNIITGTMRMMDTTHESCRIE